MHKATPPLAFLQAASKAIETVWNHPNLVLVDITALERRSVEEKRSIISLLRLALNVDSSVVSNGALDSLMQLKALNGRICEIVAQIEGQPALVAHSPFHIPGFGRVVRDTLLNLQFATQVFPDFQASPAYQMVLDEAAQLAHFLETQYGSTHQLVELLQKGWRSGRFFEL